MYKLTALEQETIINFNNAEAGANIYTCNKALIKKLIKYCELYPDTYELERQDIYSVTVNLPKKLISIRKPKVLSEAQRERLSQMMKLKSKAI